MEGKFLEKNNDELSTWLLGHSNKMDPCQPCYTKSDRFAVGCAI